MFDMDRLLELLEKALHGAETGCTVTTSAYLKLARAEWFRLIGDVPKGTLRDAFSSAAVFIDRVVDRQKSPSKAANLAFDFWLGFDDGLHERTQSQHAGVGYRRGYKFGKYGN